MVKEIVCVYCHGTGRTPSKVFPCLICKGKGRISIEEDMVKCRACRGTGKHPQSKLTCLECKGIGYIKPSVRRSSSKSSKDPFPFEMKGSVLLPKGKVID